jgi:hypothetical protein
MGEVLGQIVEDHFRLMKGTDLLIYIACGDRNGKHIDFRKGIDESCHVPQVFLGGFPDFAGVGVDDHNAGAKVFVGHPFLADQGVVLRIPSAEGKLFGTGFNGIVNHVCGKSYPVVSPVYVATGSA